MDFDFDSLDASLERNTCSSGYGTYSPLATTFSPSKGFEPNIELAGEPYESMMSYWDAERCNKELEKGLIETLGILLPNIFGSITPDHHHTMDLNTVSAIVAVPEPRKERSYRVVPTPYTIAPLPLPALSVVQC